MQEEIEYRESSSEGSDEDDSNYNNTVGTQLMNNESIGPSQDNTYENGDMAPELSAAELAAYAVLSTEKQCALDLGKITYHDMMKQ